MNKNPLIRLCTPKDAPDIYRLNCEQMHYSYPPELTAARLDALITDSRSRIFVAEVNGSVAGYIHAADYDLIYAPHIKNILGIAVASEYKRMGIGRALLGAVEDWAKQTGAQLIRLNSSSERTGAHEFYRHCGYECIKSQLNFSKKLV